MAYGLQDLKSTEKLIRGAKSLREMMKSKKGEFGENGWKALEALRKLELEMDEKYPSLMSSVTYQNLKRVEDAVSNVVASQVEDEFTMSNGRRRRLPKLVPIVCWNCHRGGFDILVRACQVPGETYALGRGIWEQGYIGDLDYDAEMQALEESRNDFNNATTVASSEEDASMPSLENLFKEEDEAQTAGPSTATSTATSFESTSKEARVRRVTVRQARSKKRQRQDSPNDFDMSDADFASLVNDYIDDEQDNRKASRKTRRKVK